MAEPTTPPEAAPEADAEPSLAAFEAELEAAVGAPASDTPVPDQGGAPGTTPETPAETPPKPPVPDAPVDAPAPEGDSEKRARAILAAATKKETEALAKAQASRAELLTLAKGSPSKFLAEAGLTVEAFLKAIQDEGSPAEPKAEDRISRIEQLLLDQRAAEKAAAEKAETDRLTKAIHEEIAASDKYPLIKAAGPEWLSEVTDLQIAYFNRHCVERDAHGNAIGIKPDVPPLDRHVAAAQVEAHLASLAAKLTPKTPPAQPASNGQPTSNRPGSPTLATLSPREVAPADDGLPMDEDARLAAVQREIAQLQ